MTAGQRSRLFVLIENYIAAGRRAAIAILLLLAFASPASAAPVTCTVGAFITGIHDLDNSLGTFKADFWMWSICPSKDIEPLKTMEFTNAASITASLDSSEQRGSNWWATRKFSGTFRQNFQLQNYPFDVEPLAIDIEEGVSDTRSFLYRADKHESKIDPQVKILGWRIHSFEIKSDTVTHPTTYGDPSLPGASSTYARLFIHLNAERFHWLSFIKATLPLYIAAFLVLMVLMFDVIEQGLFTARLGVFSTTMFAVVLSYLSLERFVGPHEGVYLLDQIHFIALVLILAATAWSVTAHLAFRHKHHDAKVTYWDRLVCHSLQVAYLLANFFVVGWAVAHGTA